METIEPGISFAVLFPLLATIFTVIGQLMFKIVAERRLKNKTGKIKQRTVFIIANLFFAGAAISYFYAFKFLPLFIVYSFTAINYVLVIIASSKILGENVKARNYIAVVMIAIGVLLITK